MFSDDMLHKRTILIALFCLVVVCIAMSFVFLAPCDMVSNESVYSDDYALHYSNALAARTFWSGWAHCWGYDPHLLAGFPSCTLANADNKAWELIVLALSPLVGSARAFKFYFIGVLFFFPLLIYAAARNFEFSRQQALSCAWLSFFFFYLSLPKDFVLWGMAAYTLSCFFSIYVLSLMYRLMVGFFSLRLFCVTIVFASLLLLNHILSPFHLIIPAAVMFALFAQRNTIARNVLIASIPFCVVVANLFWLAPLFDFLNDKTVNPHDYDFALQIKNLLEPFYVYFRQSRSLSHNVPVLNNTAFETALLLLGAAGCLLWWKNGPWRLAVAFGTGLVFIFLVTFYGSHTQFLAQFQPQRFSVALNVLLLLPAGMALCVCMQPFGQMRSRFVQALIIALLCVLAYQPLFRPFETIVRNNFYRLTCGIPTPILELIDFFEQHTNREGRILIEDSEIINRPGFFEREAYYGTHLPGLFPVFVEREFLCGPRPMYPVRHSFASFTRGVLFNRPIKDYSRDELRAAFDLFNVRWIVCWFDESLHIFGSLPDYIRPMGVIDKFTIYEVLREPSFFIKGSGSVKSDFNRIELSNVRTEDDEVIISYHWMKYLVTDSGARLEREMIGDDPVGFIKIKNPPEALTIYNGY